MLLEFVGDLIKSTGSEFFYQINFTLQTMAHLVF